MIKKKSTNLYLVLDRRILKKIYYHFVKKDKLNDYDYFTKNKKILASQKKYHDYLFNIFQKVHKLFPFNGFINFNPFYKTEVELQKVSNKLGIKFISIHKKAIHPKSYQECLKWIYKNTANKFYGTKILIKNCNRLGGKITTYCMNFWRFVDIDHIFVDIDHIEDFQMAEILDKKLNKYIFYYV